MKFRKQIVVTNNIKNLWTIKKTWQPSQALEDRQFTCTQRLNFDSESGMHFSLKCTWAQTILQLFEWWRFKRKTTREIARFSLNIYFCSIFYQFDATNMAQNGKKNSIEKYTQHIIFYMDTWRGISHFVSSGPASAKSKIQPLIKNGVKSYLTHGLNIYV